MYTRILDTDDWVVEYDAENNQYRVSYFQDYGEVSVSPNDVMGMIISKYNKDMMTKAFAQINNPVYKLELMTEFFHN